MNRLSTTMRRMVFREVSALPRPIATKAPMVA